MRNDNWIVPTYIFLLFTLINIELWCFPHGLLQWYHYVEESFNISYLFIFTLFIYNQDYEHNDWLYMSPNRDQKFVMQKHFSFESIVHLIQLWLWSWEQIWTLTLVLLQSAVNVYLNCVSFSSLRAYVLS